MSAPTAPPATTTEPGQLTKDTYRGRIHPDWCPGCGDFSVLAALQTAMFELGLQPHQVCVVSGIGCSSDLPGFVNTFGLPTPPGPRLLLDPAALRQHLRHPHAPRPVPRRGHGR